MMPCCFFVALSLIFPRAALFIMWLLNYTDTAFQTRLWPLLGFFFLPYTTCAYAIAMNEVGHIRGVGLALVLLGALLDFSSHGSGAFSSRRHAHG